MGILFAGFINLLRPLVTCFLGFIVYHWIHVMNMAEPLKKNDDAFPFVLKILAPEWGLRGVVLAGFLAAIMSTASALANSTATIFSLDVYKKLVRRDTDDRELVKAGRIASVVALVIAAAMAPLVEHVGGIFTYFQKGVTYFSAPFIAVVLMGFFWKRANYHGALFGLTAGLTVPLLLVGGFSIFDIDLHWLYIGGIAEVLVMIGIVIVSLCTPPPDPEQVRPFLWSPKLLAQYDDGKKRPWYQRVAFWWGVYAVIWFYLYWKFW
jgi:SSS family solute:Na+ symporter